MRIGKLSGIAALWLLASWSAVAQKPPVAAPAAETAAPAQFLGMIGAHNVWRREVGAPDLVWSAEAARWAQAWADELSKAECQVRHNPDPARREAYGENIYFYWSSRPYEGYRRDPATVVRSWADEQQWYDEENNQCNAPAGKTCRHYTQVVWSRSTAVGCGRARCDAAEVWVCNYSPRGNVIPVRPYELNQKLSNIMADSLAPQPEAVAEPESPPSPVPDAPVE